MTPAGEPLPPFSFCPRCGADGFTSISRRFLCRACGFEYYVNVATAVAAFVVDSRGDVLLIRRQKDPGRGRLAPPGGFVDAGETADRALRRELAEEIGLAVDRLEFLCSQPNVYRHGGVAYAVLDLFFAAPVESFVRARTLDEVEELVCLPIAQVDGAVLAFPSMQLAWPSLLAWWALRSSV